MTYTYAILEISQPAHAVVCGSQGNRDDEFSELDFDDRDDDAEDVP